MVGINALDRLLSLTVYAGRMSMQLPPFMDIEHNVAARKALLKVQDPEIRRQREMWGVQTSIYTMHETSLLT